jgi:acid phosphatase family membrane protein YuiD
VPQADRFQAMSILGKVFANKVPCVGPNSIRTVGTVIWLQSQSSGAHALLLNEVACLVNASVEDISKQARRLRELLSQKKIKCPKAALCARLSSLSRRILEHLDVPLTAFLSLNLPSVAADAVKLDVQRCIDSTCDFVAIASFDEGCSPSGTAAAITFLSCSIAALHQQVYVSFARAAAVLQAQRSKRSLRTTLLPLLREPWGISIAQCAQVAGVHSDTACCRLRRLEAAFDDCIARFFVAPPEAPAAAAYAPCHQRHAAVSAPSKRASRRAPPSRAPTPPIILYNRIPIVLQV